MPGQLASKGKYTGDDTDLTTYFNEDLEERDFTDYKYRVYTNLPGLLAEDPLNVNIYQAVCAKECPTVTPDDIKFDGTSDPTFEFEIMGTTNFTKPDADGKVNVVLSATEVADVMTILSVNSTSKYFTCMPNVAAEYAEDSDKIIEALLGQINVGFGSYITDLGKAKVPLIVMAFVVIIVTFVYIQLLQCITKPILYGSLLGIFLMLALMTYFSYDNFAKFDEASKVTDPTDYNFALAIVVICAILLVLYVVLVCCMWSAISLGASVMETASDYISDNRVITVMPFLAYIFCAPVTLWWVFTAVYIYGLGDPIFAEKSFVCDM